MADARFILKEDDTALSLPDGIIPLLTHLTPLGQAQNDDVIALKFSFIRGQYDLILSHQVGYLRYQDDTPFDMPWTTLSETQNKTLSPLAMLALNTNRPQNPWVETGLGAVIRHNHEDVETADTFLFPEGLVILPQDIDITLTSKTGDVYGLFAPFEHLSGHGHMRAKQLVAFWEHVYAPHPS